MKQILSIYTVILTLLLIVSIEAKTTHTTHHKTVHKTVHKTTPVQSKKITTTIPAQTVPKGWRISWQDEKRLSNTKQQGCIGLSTIDKTATSITKVHVNNCIQVCATTSKCGLVNLVKLKGSSLGNVVCMLYPQYYSQKAAKYTSSPQNTGGKVDYSYAIRSNCLPTNGGGITCLPAKVNTISTTTTSMRTTTIPTRTSSTSTSTTSSSTAFVTPTSPSMPFYVRQNSSYPHSPRGATLVQWAPCSQSQLTNPAMINTAFMQGSNSQTAYIVQHGAGSDFYNYFSYLYQIVGNQSPIIAPGFMTNDNSSSYNVPGLNLAYNYIGDSWTIGNADSTGAGCSSFSQFDAIFHYLTINPQKFPNLQTIVMIGHSGGGNMLSRFSTINTNSVKQMRYVIVNAANQAYFDPTRPINTTLSTNAQCGNLPYNYPYQWTGSMNAYVSQRVRGKDEQGLFANWMIQDVIHLTGDMDITLTGTQACPSLLQGGPFRRDRNYAYWAYLNMMANTNTNVTGYYGYANFTANNLQPFQPSPVFFNHQQCTVAGVGHDGQAMFESNCGQAAIFGNPLPAGAGASYPSPPPPPPLPSQQAANSTSSSSLSSSSLDSLDSSDSS